jgi:hypothetical protein
MSFIFAYGVNIDMPAKAVPDSQTGIGRWGTMCQQEHALIGCRCHNGASTDQRAAQRRIKEGFSPGEADGTADAKPSPSFDAANPRFDPIFVLQQVQIIGNRFFVLGEE